MSDNLPTPPTPPAKSVPLQKIKEQITEGDKDKTAPKQYEYSHTISHWGVFSKWFAGVASKSDTRKITPTLGQMILILCIVGILLSILKCFLNPEMWYSIYILCIPFSILWIFKYLPLAVRRVHAFGKGYLWTMVIIPFVIELATFFLSLVVGRIAAASLFLVFAAKIVIAGINVIIQAIYLLFWTLIIVFGNAPVDIDEQKQCRANSELQPSSSDNSRRLFKTTLGKYVFAASVVLCSIPLICQICQFTSTQIAVLQLSARDIEPENYEFEFAKNCSVENLNKENVVIVKLLIEAGADVNKANGDTPLYWAAKEGHTEVVKMLIEAGADVNKAGGYYGDTPLRNAAYKGHTEVVKMLIEAGADVNKANEYGETPLENAAVNGHTEVVKLLIEAGADVNKVANHGKTPLFWAAFKGHTEVAKMLIEAGADVNKADHGSGYTPLSLASELGHTEIVRALIAAGAKE